MLQLLIIIKLNIKLFVLLNLGTYKVLIIFIDYAPLKPEYQNQQ